ncbi:MAG: hypothetical protein KF753_24290 [Caldilineaceae bacterium]|nr:hypothetical protein [Caldilineaceae bacterium]
MGYLSTPPLQIDEAGKNLRRMAGASPRSYHRGQKLGRTIANFAGDGTLAAQHRAEASEYRPRGVG